MTGHEIQNDNGNRPNRTGHAVLYSLIAILTAIAGFLTVLLVERFSAGNMEQAQIVELTLTSTKAVPKQELSGFEKLVELKTPKPVPEFAFTDNDGNKRKLSDWHGKVVLVNLWATWCAPCKIEMPGLNRLQAKLGGADFAVLPISLDWSGAERPRSFLKQQKLSNLPLYMDKSKTAMKTFRAAGLPTTILIDRKGREIARLAGSAEWDSAEAIALMQKAIDTTGSNSSR